MGCTLPNIKRNPGQNSEDVNDKFASGDFVAERTNNINQDYQIQLTPIGQGSYGEVKKAQHRITKQYRAIKIIHKRLASDEEQQKLVNEVQILRKIDHPNIIKIFEFYQDPRNFYIVTEFCPGGQLFDYILDRGQLNEATACKIMRQVISSIMYLHNHNIVHRDLKPENILLAEADTKDESFLVKLIDFGTSQIFSDKQHIKGKFGTPYYIAPEILKGTSYSEKCDIWSLGVIFYIFLCGYPPFNGDSDEEIMEKVKVGKYQMVDIEWDYVSDEAKDLIQNMICYDDRKRFSAQQVMEHPWMQMNFENQTVDLQQMSISLQNMKNFATKNKFQEATYMFIVNFLSSKEDQDKLMKIFKSLDKNGDGQLSKEELIEGKKVIKGYKQKDDCLDPEGEVQKIFDECDKNRSGYIDYTEFVAASMNQSNLINKKQLQTAFSMIDKDGSGKISVEELKNTFGKKLPNGEWEQMVREVDENGDGEISFEEFKNIMLKILDKPTEKQ